MKIGVIGCGMISDWYFKAAQRFPMLEITACADARAESAQSQGAKYGIPAVPVDAIFADPEIELVLNLTPPKIHYAIARRTLESGKHAYSEKPFAVRLDEARELLELARRQNRRIGCAPDTFLGGGQQSVRKLIDDRWIGKVLAGTAIFTGRGPETWAHAPAFYDEGAGPMLDLGPYFVTQLVNLLGPAKAVTAVTCRGAAERVGGPDTVPRVYPVRVDTHQTGIIEFASGAVITVLGSYEVYRGSHPFLELYGDGGSISMHHPNYFGGPVKLFLPGYEDWQDVPPAHIYNSDARSLGVADMVDAIEHDRPHRASGELAFHVLEILLAFVRSGAAGKRVELESRCERPEPMPLGLRDGEVS